MCRPLNCRCDSQIPKIHLEPNGQPREMYFPTSIPERSKTPPRLQPCRELMVPALTGYHVFSPDRTMPRPICFSRDMICPFLQALRSHLNHVRIHSWGGETCPSPVAVLPLCRRDAVAQLALQLTGEVRTGQLTLALPQLFPQQKRKDRDSPSLELPNRARVHYRWIPFFASCPPLCVPCFSVLDRP